MKTIYILLLCLCPIIINAQKIPLDFSNIINITLVGNANALVDEQALAGDPKNGTSGKPTTNFSYGVSTQVYYPLEVVVDLKGGYTLTNIYLFDSYGVDSLFISSGSPNNWTTLAKVNTDEYMQWRFVSVNATTRYLRLKFKSGSTLISEIVLYGTLFATVPSPVSPSPVTMPRPLMEDFIGMNSFNNVPDSINKVVKQIREYHDWGWDEGNTDNSYPGFPNNQYAWNPSWVVGWNFDAFYGNCKKEGITVCPALELDAPYMLGFNSIANNNNKPIRGNKDPENPLSYPEHADWMYQYAARYGATPVNAANLKLRSDNTAESGLGYLNYIENWNEPDKTWISDTAYFTPFQFAAMSSADYDGHLSAMGKTFGVKNADPTMNFVMGGLVNADTAYLKIMLFWANTVRNGIFPADVLNFHHYSNDGGGQGGTQTMAYSPEQDSLKQKVAAVVAYRDKNLPGKPVWFSEFGYDTNPNSIQGAPAIGAQSSWETQARWIIRSYLAIAAGGADRAHMFMLPDVYGPSSSEFSSSGLTTASTDDGTYAAYTKKTSWYYLYTFRKLLTGYQFAGEVSSGNASVLIYSFTKASNPADSIIYAVWSPTRTDATISNYKLTLPNSFTGATQIELTNGDTTGVSTVLTTSGGQAILTVDEKPDFIVLIQSAVTSVVNSVSAAYVKVYPNPFSNELTIELPKGVSEAKANLLDITGHSVKSLTLNGSVCKVDASGLSNGMYLLQVNTPLYSYTIKVIKAD